MGRSSIQKREVRDDVRLEHTGGQPAQKPRTHNGTIKPLH